MSSPEQPGLPDFDPTAAQRENAEQVQQEWLTDQQAMAFDVSATGRMVSSAIMTMGILTGLFGLILLFWPGATVRVVAVLFGIWLIVTGLIMLAQAIGSSASGFLRLLLGVGGVLSFLVGGVCVFNGDASVTILVIFVLIGWVANGLSYIVVGIREKYSPNRGAYFIFGGVQILLAALVIAWPEATVTVLVRVIGIGLLLTAVLQIWAARRIKKNVNQGPDVIVVESQ